MNFTTSFGLLLLGLFLLPVLVSGCLPYRRDGVPWYEARRDPTGLAPDPATTPEAVIQVYAARAVSWRGVFSMHTWIAVKRTGAPRYTRYEVLGFGVANGAPAVRIDRMGPDNYWFGARPKIILDHRGPDVDAMIEDVRAAVARNRPVILPMSGRRSRSIIAGTHSMGAAFGGNMSSGAPVAMSFMSRLRPA